MIDIFADLLQETTHIPLDFLPEMVGHSDPAYIVEELEEELIECFGVNINGNTVA